MIKLNIPRVKQTAKACGPSSLLQVMQFFGFNKELPEMIKELKVLPEEFNRSGVSEGTLGVYAIENGFQAMMISYDTKRFDPSWNFNNPDLLKTKLAQQLTFLKEASNEDRMEGYSTYYKSISTEHLLEFVNQGGIIKFQHISHQLIENFIEENTPPLALVNSQLYFSNPRRYRGNLNDISGKEHGHWVVISGFDEENYWITDPADDIDPNGVFKIEKDKLLNQIIQYGPIMLVVSKKQKDINKEAS